MPRGDGCFRGVGGFWEAPLGGSPPPCSPFCTPTSVARGAHFLPPSVPCRHLRSVCSLESLGTGNQVQVRCPRHRVSSTAGGWAGTGSRGRRLQRVPPPQLKGLIKESAKDHPGWSFGSWVSLSSKPSWSCWAVRSGLGSPDQVLLCPLCPVSRCQQGAVVEPVLHPGLELVPS